MELLIYGVKQISKIYNIWYKNISISIFLSDYTIIEIKNSSRHIFFNISVIIKLKSNITNQNFSILSKT